MTHGSIAFILIDPFLLNNKNNTISNKNYRKKNKSKHQ